MARPVNPHSRRQQNMRWKNKNHTPGAIQLPGDGYGGEIPDWPIEAEEVADSELDLWQDLWRTPQAAMWADSGFEYIVARYVKLYQLSLIDTRAGYLSELRQIETSLGLSPLGLKRLNWVIGEDTTTPEEPAGKSAREKYGHLAVDNSDLSPSEILERDYGKRFADL